jgi:hypothetical protein
MRWTGYVARTANLRKHIQNLAGKPEGNKFYGDLHIYGRIITCGILRKAFVRLWTVLDSSGAGNVPVANPSEGGSESSVS